MDHRQRPQSALNRPRRYWVRVLTLSLLTLVACSEGEVVSQEGEEGTRVSDTFQTRTDLNAAPPREGADAVLVPEDTSSEPTEGDEDGQGEERADPREGDADASPQGEQAQDAASASDAAIEGDATNTDEGVELPDTSSVEGDAELGPEPELSQDAESDADEADSEAGPSADAELVLCSPGEALCVEQSVMVCSADGLSLELSEACSTLETCLVDACVSLCEAAALSDSSEGCAFLAVTTVNEYLPPSLQMDFAIVVANSIENPPASVTVSRAGELLEVAEVEPGATYAFSLPMIPELVESEHSVLVSGAAYEVTSTVPVAAYQYNPLHFEDAAQEFYSFTNDASLLLPEHALGTSYMAMSWPTWGKIIAWTAGFVTLTAVSDDTEVTFTAAATTLPNPEGELGLEAGESLTLILNRGDVLQFQGWTQNESFFQLNAETCPAPDFNYDGLVSCQALNTDLTGSTLTSSAPLAVFSGHDCLRIPYDTEACDHVEEMLLPTDAWGQEFLFGAPQRPDIDATASAEYRVVALEDNTTVGVTPAGIAGPFLLNAGEVVSFTTDADLRISADKRVQVMQALLSAQGLNPPAVVDDGVSLGDPAMGTGVPQRQAKAAYVFQVPATYQSNWANVVRFIDAEVLLDGEPLSGFSQIANTPYEVARISLSPGTHQITSSGGTSFTIMNYGYAPFTSYLYPGGMKIEK
ncbi:MAG: hypothetical protein ACPGU1_17870 [Myxococcota bacterium]